LSYFSGYFMRLFRPAIIAPLLCSIYLIAIAVQSQHVYVWLTLPNHSIPEELLPYSYTAEGYDGYYGYLIARDPVDAARTIDSPPYRFQRILLPALVRFFSFGQKDALPYLFAGINLLMLGLGTWGIEYLLKEEGLSVWYALGYAFTLGIFGAVRMSLAEPLAFGLVVLGIVMTRRERWLGAAALFAMAALAKETTLFFPAAFGFYLLYQRKWKEAMRFGLITLLPFILWEAALYRVFGNWGFSSGGSEGFELIPFNAYFKILGAGNISVSILYSVLFLLFVFVPLFWSFWRCIRDFQLKQWTIETQVLAFNILIIPFIPFTTFREINGLLRFIVGMQIAIIWYAASKKHSRPLSYSTYWMFTCLLVISSDIYILGAA
jgi:hypothetical protein